MIILMVSAFAWTIPTVAADPTPYITINWDSTGHKLTINSVVPDDVLWSDLDIDGVCNTSGLGTYITPGDEITHCYKTITITYIPNNEEIGSWSFAWAPNIECTMDDDANTLTVTYVVLPDILWSDVEFIGICNTSGLGTYATPGDIITNCYYNVELNFIPTSNTIHVYCFSPFSVILTADDYANTLTVALAMPSDILWSDVDIDGTCDISGLGTYVVAGDVITNCYGTISLIYVPFNMDLGEFEFSAQSSNGNLWGQVFGYTDDGSNYRLLNALITVKTYDGQLVDSDYTDSDGCYYFYPIEAGTYKVEASKEGYIGAESLNVVVETGETTRVNLDLQQIPGGPGWVYGWVDGKNDEGTFRLEGALIMLKTPDGEYVDSTLSLSNGFYHIFLVDAGTYKLEVTKDGYVGVETLNVVVEPGIGTQNDYILYEIGYQWTGWIYGTVLGTTENGTFPLKDALVSVILGNSTVASTYTNSNGSYYVYVEPGTYSVEASKEGYSTMGKMFVVVEEDKGTQVDFNLPETVEFNWTVGWIYGTVLGTNDNGTFPLEDALIDVRTSVGDFSNRSTEFVDSTYAYSNGYYRIYVEPGTYQVTASKEGYSMAATINVIVKSDKGTNRDFNLSETGQFHKKIIYRPNSTFMDKAIDEGNVGSEVLIWQKQPNIFQHEILIHNGVEIKNLDVQKGSISFVVSGNETIGGKTIAINVDTSVFDPSSQIFVNYDGEPIDMADDINDILDPNDDGSHPEYLISIGSNGIQILISIPHFSDHFITFFNLTPEQVALFLEYAIIAAVGLIIIAAVVMFRKGKED